MSILDRIVGVVKPNLDVDTRRGELSWRDFPNCGECKRCKSRWGSVKDHTTYFCPGHVRDGILMTDGVCQGVFVLCEWCWRELTPELRLPFYRVHWEQGEMSNRLHGGYDWQVEEHSRSWPALMNAVLTEEMTLREPASLLPNPPG